MTEVSMPLRKDVPMEHTWNDISVFATPEVWEEEYIALGEALILISLKITVDGLPPTSLPIRSKRSHP